MCLKDRGGKFGTVFWFECFSHVSLFFFFFLLEPQRSMYVCCTYMMGRWEGVF